MLGGQEISKAKKQYVNKSSLPLRSYSNISRAAWRSTPLTTSVSVILVELSSKHIT